MSWVVVQFAECREVFIDDQNQGDNVDAQGRLNPLLVNAGTHTFTLGGAPNFAPPSQTLLVPEVSIGTPFSVIFAKTA
ncbi:MAG TPA: hypothetical protein VFV05_02715 [Methylomirabilota bacterium]|nr:hypothetical protein [Methylomirabilota bacterium]